MANQLLFNFTVNKTNNTIHITREFQADQESVWSTFTEQELLDQWWAPKPWMSKTKSMNFENGGRRLYAMVSPEGMEHWAVQDFNSIAPIKTFSYSDAFSDKDGNINPELPSSEWTLNFSADNEMTTVAIVITHKSLTDLEQIIEMGFKEGFTQTLATLDDLLNNPKKTNS